MDAFIYWSFVIVIAILVVKNGWKLIKFLVKVWYNVFALIVVGVLFFAYIFPALFKLFLH